MQNFQLGKFHKTIYHANRASQYKNGYSSFAKEYIYWSYLLLGNEFLANEIYQELNPDYKRRINNKPFRFLKSIAINSGIGSSSGFEKNLKLIGIEISQKYSQALNVNYGFNF